jgi:hypothetical protein
MFTECSFFIFIVLVGYIQYKRKEHDEDEQTDEWNFTQFRTLEHLFSPTAGLFSSIMSFSWSVSDWSVETSSEFFSLCRCEDFFDKYLHDSGPLVCSFCNFLQF